MAYPFLNTKDSSKKKKTGSLYYLVTFAKILQRMLRILIKLKTFAKLSAEISASKRLWKAQGHHRLDR